MKKILTFLVAYVFVLSNAFGFYTYIMDNDSTQTVQGKCGSGNWTTIAQGGNMQCSTLDSVSYRYGTSGNGSSISACVLAGPHSTNGHKCYKVNNGVNTSTCHSSSLSASLACD